MRWSEVTAVFGGTFDPPHLGHREAVRGLFENPGIRRAIVVPSAIPPFKPQAASSENRLRMAELSFQGLADVRVDRRELDRAAQASLPSYSIDTILELKRESPHLAFVVGADQLVQFPGWHRFPDLLGSCHWIILGRKPDGQVIAQRTLNEWSANGLLRKDGAAWQTAGGTRLVFAETDAPAISSTEVRAEIARATSLESLVNYLKSRLTPEVVTYLMEQRIYGMRPHEHES